MLSIHGTDDQLVPYNQSVILHKALIKAGCESTLITVKGGRHGGFNSPEIDKRLEAFFAKHLLGAKVKVEGGEIDQERPKTQQQ